MKTLPSYDDGHFIVTQDGKQWRCRPGTRRIVMLVTVMVSTAAILFLGGIIIDHFAKADAPIRWSDNARYPFTIFGSIAAAIFLAAGVWMWYVRNDPLVIDKATGEVRIGRKRICSSGTVRCVLLRRSDTTEDGIVAYDFYFRLKDARTISVPSPYFCQLCDVERASALAEQVAAALNVQLVREF